MCQQLLKVGKYDLQKDAFVLRCANIVDTLCVVHRFKLMRSFYYLA